MEPVLFAPKIFTPTFLPDFCDFPHAFFFFNKPGACSTIDCLSFSSFDPRVAHPPREAFNISFFFHSFSL